MPYADVLTFVASLRACAQTNGRLALIFQILTAAGPGEVRAARSGQIDMAKQDWRRPKEMMKMGAEHIATLNAPALTLLMKVKSGRTVRPDELIFPGRGEGLFSDMTLKKVLRTAGQPYDVHGSRSSFS